MGRAVLLNHRHHYPRKGHLRNPSTESLAITAPALSAIPLRPEYHLTQTHCWTTPSGGRDVRHPRIPLYPTVEGGRLVRRSA